MIKAVVFDSDGVYDSHISSDTPPVIGAFVETYFVPQERTPTTIVTRNYRAVLNDKGEPVIQCDLTEEPELSYEDWCKVGIDHTEEIITHHTRKVAPFKEWKYTRKVEKRHWVVIIESLEHLKEILDTYECELARDTYYTPEYILRIF